MQFLLVTLTHTICAHHQFANPYIVTYVCVMKVIKCAGVDSKMILFEWSSMPTTDLSLQMSHRMCMHITNLEVPVPVLVAIM